MKPTYITQPEEAESQLPTIGLVLGAIETEYEGLYWKGVLDALKEQQTNALCFVSVPLVIEWHESIDKLLLNKLVPPSMIDERMINTAYVGQRALQQLINQLLLSKLMPPSMIDGLVINTAVMRSYVGEHQLQQFIEQFEAVPIVNAGIPFDQRTTLSVQNYAGMYALVEHLIVEHGLRHIACLRGPVGHQEAEERLAAYCDALDAHDIQFDEKLVITGNSFNELMGKSAMRQLLASEIPFDAVVAQSDGMALGALAILEENGYRVPQDVTVTGFNDMERMAFLELPLTTVHQPIREQARLSVELLLEEIHSGQVAPCVALPTQAIFRRSCGCNAQEDIAQYRQHIQILNERVTDIRLAEQNMRIFMTAPDWQTLAALLAERLPQLGIHRCYLNLFDEEAEPWQSRLVAGFDESGVVALPPDGLCFPSSLLLPPEIWSRIQRFQMMVLLLHARDELIGFALIEIGQKDGWVYETIRGQLSAIARTIKLARQVQGHSSHLEAVVQERTADLLQLLDERKEWAEVVVHDLRNPLSSIHLTASLVEKRLAGYPEEQAQERLRIISQTTRNMNAIISKLLEERHAYDELVNNQKFMLLPVIDTVLKQQQSSLQIKQIDIRSNIPAENFYVTADPDMVLQVLDNLLSNAIKFSPFRSTVTVSVKHKDNGVCVAVKDEGTGILPEDHDKMFTKFGKLSAKPTNGEASTGVGLYIAKKMIDAIGGQISAESDGADSGSTFKIWLPD